MDDEKEGSQRIPLAKREEDGEDDEEMERRRGRTEEAVATVEVVVAEPLQTEPLEPVEQEVLAELVLLLHSLAS